MYKHVMKNIKMHNDRNEELILPSTSQITHFDPPRVHNINLTFKPMK